jgi:hypothetical protein
MRLPVLRLAGHEGFPDEKVSLTSQQLVQIERDGRPDAPSQTSEDVRRLLNAQRQRSRPAPAHQDGPHHRHADGSNPLLQGRGKNNGANYMEENGVTIRYYELVFR